MSSTCELRWRYFYWLLQNRVTCSFSLQSQNQHNIWCTNYGRPTNARPFIFVSTFFQVFHNLPYNQELCSLFCYLLSNEMKGKIWVSIHSLVTTVLLYVPISPIYTKPHQNTHRYWVHKYLARVFLYYSYDIYNKSLSQYTWWSQEAFSGTFAVRMCESEVPCRVTVMVGLGLTSCPLKIMEDVSSLPTIVQKSKLHQPSNILDVHDHTQCVNKNWGL